MLVYFLTSTRWEGPHNLTLRPSVRLSVCMSIRLHVYHAREVGGSNPEKPQTKLPQTFVSLVNFIFTLGIEFDSLSITDSSLFIYLLSTLHVLNFIHVIVIVLLLLLYL